MTTKLPQKYQEVAKALIPYVPTDTAHKMAVVSLEPALPCIICNQPATMALITPAPDYAPEGAGTPWLTFPVCRSCETRQVKGQTSEPE